MEAAPHALLIVAATAEPLLIVIVSGLLGGGGLTAWAAFRRAKPQAQLDITQSAKLMLEEARADRVELREQIKLARGAEQAAIEAYRALRLQHDTCEDRIDELEDRVAELQREVDRHASP